jgi:hypothetical protein
MKRHIDKKGLMKPFIFRLKLVMEQTGGKTTGPFVDIG